MKDVDAAMIALDMGASDWRAARLEDGVPRVLEHRFVSRRFAPFIQKTLAHETTEFGGMQVLVDNYKRFLGQSPRRSLIGEASMRVWLARRLAALWDDVSPRVNARHLGIVIPLPSCFRDRERRDVVDAAHDAGFVHVEIPDETTLVVNDCAAGEADPSPLLYFHLGAGTFSLSLLDRAEGSSRLRETAYEGTFLLGGDDFDMLMMDLILANACKPLGIRSSWDLRRFADERLRRECEDLKKRLSSGTVAEARLNVGRFHAGRAALHPEFELKVDTGIFPQVMAPAMKKIDDYASRFFSRLREAGVDTDDIKRVLIGGGAAQGMPSTWEHVLHHAGVSAEVKLLPGSVYVEAAARYADTLEAEFRKSLQDKDPSSLPQRTVSPFDPETEVEGSTQTEEAARQAVEALGGPAGPETGTQAESDARAARTPPVDLSASRWAAKYGEWIARAELMHKEDPLGAVRGLCETAVRLMELAQHIGSRAPECHAFSLPLSMLGHACGLFFGWSTELPMTAETDSSVAAAASIDPLLASVLVAAQALSANGDMTGANEALQLASTRMAKHEKAASRARTAESREQVTVLSRLLFRVRASIAFREAESLVRSFERHCDLAKQVRPQDKRRECEAAADDLEKALDCMNRIAGLFRDAGVKFDGTEYSRKGREWRNVLKRCRKERGL